MDRRPPRLGYATLPSAYADAPELDGVVIDHASVPGGTAPGAGLGKTLVHEAGHWLGLWHTFENGCTALNDEVADTPAQSGPSAGCPQARDSCSRPGQDPVHNYMDYSSDACYNQFSEGQAERMRAAWTTFREKS
ncbi:M43 family zinc metalloprotease [Actinokineospora soli]|uniref:M43 family zinc metalloprotease n=1 Tax=Actinokineospora soli TaxID=1048753 RepID=A0ABW2TXY8_9PSEU